MRCLTREQCRYIHNKIIFEEKLMCVDKCPKGYSKEDSRNVSYSPFNEINSREKLIESSIEL